MPTGHDGFEGRSANPDLRLARLRRAGVRRRCVEPPKSVSRPDAERRQTQRRPTIGGRSGSGNSRSPRSTPRAVPPSRKNGTSAPSATAIEPLTGVGDAPEPAQRAHGRRRVAAATAEAGLHRNPFDQVERDTARRARSSGRLHTASAARQTRFARPGRTRRVVTCRTSNGPFVRRNCQLVVQRDRLKDRPQLVIAVRPRADDAERRD